MTIYIPSALLYGLGVVGLFILIVSLAINVVVFLSYKNTDFWS